MCKNATWVLSEIVSSKNVPMWKPFSNTFARAIAIPPSSIIWVIGRTAVPTCLMLVVVGSVCSVSDQCLVRISACILHFPVLSGKRQCWSTGSRRTSVWSFRFQAPLLYCDWWPNGTCRFIENKQLNDLHQCCCSSSQYRKMQWHCW